VVELEQHLLVAGVLLKMLEVSVDAWRMSRGCCAPAASPPGPLALDAASMMINSEQFVARPEA